jgi:outer membrane protein, heavy metal efflux system
MMHWLVLLFASSIANANAPVTLEGVLASVKASYPALQGAEKDVAAAEGEVTSNQGAFDIQWKTSARSSLRGFYVNDRLDTFLEQPTPFWGATLFAGYRFGSGNFASYDNRAKTLSGGELRAGLEIPIWRNGPTDRRRANIWKSEKGLDAARGQLQITFIQSMRSAAQRYFDWTAAGRRLKIQKEMLQIAETRDKGLRERTKHGDLPEFERRDNERAILQRRSMVIAAQRSVQQTAFELSLFLRDSEGNPLVPTEEQLPADLPPVPSVSSDPLVSHLDRAVKQRPEMAVLLSQRQQNEIEFELADNQMAPRIDLQVAAERGLGTGDPSSVPSELEAGIYLEIPLQRRTASGRKESALATRQRIELQERLMRDRIQMEVRDAHSNLVAAIERHHVSHGELELAKELEEGERTRFKNGDSNILFINLREQLTVDAALRELDALLECHRSAVALQAAIGDTLSL